MKILKMTKKITHQKTKILYISFTGMGEALGKSQVLAYLKGLSENHDIYLLSFEKKNDLAGIELLHKEVKSYEIEWHYLTYSNKYGALSTITLIISGIISSLKITKKHNIEILHARSMIPAIMAFPSKILYNAKLLFDIRGFSTDEKVDRERIKKNSLTYNILIYIEVFLYKNSNFIVTLTNKARETLHKKYKIPLNNIEVISTCADPNIFFPISKKRELKEKLGFEKNKKILLHSGSVTGWYLFEEEILLYKELKKRIPELIFLILNEHAHKHVVSLMEKHDIKKSDYKILSIKFEEINDYINIVDAAIFFIKPTFSKSASAPTKFAEYVSAHLPSITNKNVGDMEELMTTYNVGSILDIKNIKNSDIEKCVFTINNDLDSVNYQNLFNDLLNKDRAILIYAEIYKKMSKS